jgi:hypothetical protein
MRPPHRRLFVHKQTVFVSAAALRGATSGSPAARRLRAPCRRSARGAGPSCAGLRVPPPVWEAPTLPDVSWLPANGPRSATGARWEDRARARGRGGRRRSGMRARPSGRRRNASRTSCLSSRGREGRPVPIGRGFEGGTLRCGFLALPIAQGLTAELQQAVTVAAVARLRAVSVAASAAGRTLAAVDKGSHAPDSARAALPGQGSIGPVADGPWVTSRAPRPSGGRPGTTETGRRGHGFPGRSGTGDASADAELVQGREQLRGIAVDAEGACGEELILTVAA